MRLIAGWKLGVIAATVLAVGSIFLYVTRSIQSNERDKIQIELQEQEDDTRQRVQEAVRPSRNPSVDDSLRYLRERSSD